jgi:hypothetical protein
MVLGSVNLLWTISAIACYTIVTIYQMLSRVMGEAYPAYAIFSPLGGILTAAIIIRSTYRTLVRKGVRWKGRMYIDLIGIERRKGIERRRRERRRRRLFWI